MSFSETDPFDAAAAEAEAELGGETPAEEAPSSEPSVPTSAEVVETESLPTEETPAAPRWHDGHDDDVVDVGGQEVTLAELRQGYLRQSDYTRKTQEVAAERKAAQWARDFQEHLRRDPMGTLQALAEEYKLLPADADGFDPDEVTPEAIELHQVRQDIEELKIRRIEAEIRQEVADMKNRYADFDPETVLPFIAEKGSQGVGLSIEEGYFVLRGRDTHQRDLAAQAAKAKADERAAVEAAKRQAQVEPGQSAAGVTDDDAARYRSMSIEDIANEIFPDDYQYQP